MQRPITIFCAFTRHWAIDIWLENLAAVEHDQSLTNLVFIVDIDDPRIKRDLDAFAARNQYRSYQCVMNEDWHPNEVRLSIRRMRVADVHNQSKALVAKTDGEFVIGLEDDTVFDRLTSFDRLLQPFHNDNVDRIGFVEGVQMGRWGANMVGVWQADDVLNPNEMKTMLPPDGKWEGLQEITGGGWYGYATPRQLYLDCDYYTSSSQPWGPDVNYGLWLRQRGYNCLVDWGIVFGHNDHNIIGYPDNPPRGALIEVVYTRDTLTGRWERRDYEKHNDQF